ncbi:phospholipase D-like domain-containing protein [Kitasatospora sp. NPDC092948]|uniref:phospholipase D-like domain-containing protein n=1 Tax=Kitasatospora sp. NPDC092948 TaxID=3364088 RepID=UPI003818967D
MSLTRRLLRTLAAGATVAATALAPVTAGHAATGTYTLVVLPDQGENAIYNLVNSANKSVDVTIYELRDTTLTTALVNRQKAGVNVRVVMDPNHSSVNSAAYTALTAGGVSVVYSASTFTYTHQKTITVDGATSYVSTGNFDTTYYSTSRDYGVLDTDPADVAAIEQVFNADYAHTAITPSDGTDLVWSPTDSQNRLLALINGAQHSLDVQEEEFGDTALVNAVVAAAQRGVAVRVVAEDTAAKYTAQFNQVTAAGGQVTTYTSSTGFYVHAKAIVADYGTSTAKVFAGSENFSDNSLNHNRELGLIVSDPGVISGIESTFTADFNRVPSTGGTTPPPTGNCTPAQLLGNPGFETGALSPWTGTAGTLNNTSSEPAHSGSWDVWLDGYGTAHTETLTQTVTVPAGCTASLSYWLHVDTAETTTTTAYDTLTVTANGTAVATHSNLDHNTGYTQHTVDLSAYAGQSVTLTFTGTEDYQKQTSFVLDDLALNVS